MHSKGAEEYLELMFGFWGCGSQWRTQEFCSGGFNKFSWGQRRERGSEGGSPL